MSTYPKTPTLDKISAVSDQSHQIGEFLDWLREQKILLCQWDEAEQGDLNEIGDGPEALLYRYFGIDEKKAEQERRAVLEFVRNPPEPTKEAPLVAPIYKGLPSLETLGKWATPRLVKFYKIHRAYPTKYWDEIEDPQMEQFAKYLQGIKEILARREHVPVKK
jgi:hypothetical protein